MDSFPLPSDPLDAASSWIVEYIQVSVSSELAQRELTHKYLPVFLMHECLQECGIPSKMTVKVIQEKHSPKRHLYVSSVAAIEFEDGSVINTQGIKSFPAIYEAIEKRMKEGGHLSPCWDTNEWATLNFYLSPHEMIINEMVDMLKNDTVRIQFNEIKNSVIASVQARKIDEFTSKATSLSVPKSRI